MLDVSGLYCRFISLVLLLLLDRCIFFLAFLLLRVALVVLADTLRLYARSDYIVYAFNSTLCLPEDQMFTLCTFLSGLT